MLYEHTVYIYVIYEVSFLFAEKVRMMCPHFDNKFKRQSGIKGKQMGHNVRVFSLV